MHGSLVHRKRVESGCIRYRKANVLFLFLKKNTLVLISHFIQQLVLQAPHRRPSNLKVCTSPVTEHEWVKMCHGRLAKLTRFKCMYEPLVFLFFFLFLKENRVCQNSFFVLQMTKKKKTILDNIGTDTSTLLYIVHYTPTFKV